MAPIIQPDALKALMGTPGLVIVDARGGPDARKNFEAQHIPGAIFVDLETDLSDIGVDAKDGGRHPLPDPVRFTGFLRGIGIQPDTHVVVYDDRSGAMGAARFWWMLRALGHTRVQVLNGGLAAAVREGLAVNADAGESSATETPMPRPSHEKNERIWAENTEGMGLPKEIKGWKLTEDRINWGLPTASMEEVAAATDDAAACIIDVREPERYGGLTEPYDLVAGHIPGAVNIFYGGNLDAEGHFLPPEQLRAKYRHIAERYGVQQVIVHCGSGVTACHTLLAMDQAGLGIPLLYVGSYSEWIRNGKPVVGQ